MICSDIWHKCHERYFKIVIRNSRAVRRVKFETIFKYHGWYLCQISRTYHAIIKQLLDEVEHDIMNYQNRGLCSAEADNTDTRF